MTTEGRLDCRTPLEDAKYAGQTRPLLRRVAPGLSRHQRAGQRRDQQLENITEICLRPQIQSGQVHPVPQAIQDRPRPSAAHQQPRHSLPVEAQDGLQLLNRPVLPVGLNMVEQLQKCGEQIPPIPLQQFSQPVLQHASIGLHQIAEELLLVGEVHIEAATGDAGRPDHPVDRRRLIGNPGKLRPGRRQEPLPLLRRQIVKGRAGHGLPPNLTSCHIS